MQLLFKHYKNIAFFVTKLPLFCKAACIMSIMKKNYSLTSIVQTAKPRLGNLAGFVFMRTAS